LTFFEGLVFLGTGDNTGDEFVDETIDAIGVLCCEDRTGDAVRAGAEDRTGDAVRAGAEVSAGIVGSEGDMGSAFPSFVIVCTCLFC
jgi:hypothetical protein